MSKRDYYQVLDVPRTATEADLKKANDRITELERMADPNQQRPHLGGAPVQRTDDADPQKAKRDELQTLQGTDWTTKTTAEKNAAFVRMQELRNDLGV